MPPPSSEVRPPPPPSAPAAAVRVRRLETRMLLLMLLLCDWMLAPGLLRHLLRGSSWRPNGAALWRRPCRGTLHRRSSARAPGRSRIIGSCRRSWCWSACFWPLPNKSSTHQQKCNCAESLTPATVAFKSAVDTKEVVIVAAFPSAASLPDVNRGLRQSSVDSQRTYEYSNALTRWKSLLLQICT